MQKDALEKKYKDDLRFRYFVNSIDYEISRKGHELELTSLERQEGGKLAAIHYEMRENESNELPQIDLYVDEWLMIRKMNQRILTEKEKEQLDKEYEQIMRETDSEAVKRCLGAYLDDLKNGYGTGSLKDHALDLVIDEGRQQNVCAELESCKI